MSVLPGPVSIADSRRGWCQERRCAARLRYRCNTSPAKPPLPPVAQIRAIAMALESVLMPQNQELMPPSLTRSLVPLPHDRNPLKDRLPEQGDRGDPRRAPSATKPAMRWSGCSSHLFLDPVRLPLPSRHHSTPLPSPGRYDNRYEPATSGSLSHTLQEHLPSRHFGE